MREHIDRQLKELERYGVKAAVERTKGGHIRIRWGARQLYAASTPTDHRGVLNNIAIIRQWMREDNILPTDERLPIRERIKTHEQGKVKLGPLLAHIEKLEAQVKELFEYITDPAKALTAEPPAAYEGKRVPSTDALQYLNETDWTPVGKLALKWNRPYASVMSALKQLELKGLAVNYKGVGWKRTPPQAVQVKVKPVVLVASPPVQPAKPTKKLPVVGYPNYDWLSYFNYGHWTTAIAFAEKAHVSHPEAHRIARELEAQGHLQYDAKQGWRRWAKRKTLVPQRQTWGGRTHGVPSDALLPYITRKYQANRELAAAWGRTLSQTTDALKNLQKRGLVENKRYVGWRLSSPHAPAKANGKHHMTQEQHH